MIQAPRNFYQQLWTSRERDVIMLDFLDEEYLDREEQRLLRKYDCTSIKQVLEKQDRIIVNLKERVPPKGEPL